MEKLLGSRDPITKYFARVLGIEAPDLVVKDYTSAQEGPPISVEQLGDDIGSFPTEVRDVLRDVAGEA